MEDKKISLSDIINSQPVAEKEEVKATADYKSLNTYSDAKVQENVNMKEVLPMEDKSFKEEKEDELMQELDDGIEAAKLRRFQPAIDEINEMREEYNMRLAAGEKDPKVLSKYTNEDEINPDLTEEEVLKRRAQREEEDFVNRPVATKNLKLVEKDIIEDDELDEEEKALLGEEEPQSEEEVEENLEDDGTVTEEPSEQEVEELIQELDEDDDDTETQDDKAEEFNRLAREKFSATIKAPTLDVSKFTVAKRPIALNKVLRNTSTATSYYDWALFNSGISISMSPMSILELEEINPFSNEFNANIINRTQLMFNTIYKHLDSKCKDGSMETWIKTLRFNDLDHLWFAIYNACFSKSNILPHTCTNDKCKFTFPEEHPIIDLVNFKDDETKAKAKAIIDKDASKADIIEEELFVINDNLVAGLTIPSIFNVAFENALLNEEFSKKYINIIAIGMCINSLYTVDTETMQLIPIQFRTNNKDIVKNYKLKILSMYKILNNIDSASFKRLESKVTSILTNADNGMGISYQIPGATCPKCGTKIEPMPIVAQQLVFIRHQLTQTVH